MEKDPELEKKLRMIRAFFGFFGHAEGKIVSDQIKFDSYCSNATKRAKLRDQLLSLGVISFDKMQADSIYVVNPKQLEEETGLRLENRKFAMVDRAKAEKFVQQMRNADL